VSAGMAVKVILVHVGGRSIRASLNHSDWLSAGLSVKRKRDLADLHN
jgi:hypothetical protein